MQNYLSKKVRERRIAQALLCAAVFGIGVGATPHLIKCDNGYKMVMSNEAKAEEVKQELGIKQVAAGWGHTVFIKNDGTVWSTGLNSQGQLGLGNISSRNTPTQISIDNVKEVVAGNNNTFFIKNDGTVWATGNNPSGELGLGDTKNRNVPTKVDIDNIKCVVTGENHTIFIKNDGTAWGTGNNSRGQLGLGDTSNRNIPTKINIDNVKEVVIGNNHTIFIKDDGTAWGTGSNLYGQLGLGDTTDRYIPAKIDIDNVKEIISGYDNTFFIKNDGTVLAIGYNSQGQLGLGDTTSRNTPTQISIDNVKKVVAGYNHTIFMKNDGTVWATGENYRGELGLGDRTDRRVPTKININNIKQVINIGFNTIFIKNDGTIWVTGNNSYGNFGLGDRTERHIPTNTSSMWHYQTQYTVDKVYNLGEVQKYGSWADAYYGKDLFEDNFNYFTSSTAKQFIGIIDDSQIAKKFMLPNGRVVTIDNYGMVNDYKTFTTTQPVTVPIDGTTIKGDVFLGNIDGKGLVPMFEKDDGYIWYIDTDNQVRMLPIQKTDYTDTFVYHLANNVSNKFLFIKNDGKLVYFDSNRFEKETAINMNDVEKVLPATNVTTDLFLMKDGTIKNLDGTAVNFQGKKLVKILSNRYLVMDDNMIYTLQGTTIKTTNTLATLYNKAVNDLLWLKNGKVMRADTSGNVSFLNDVNGALVKDIVKADETGSFILMKDNTTKAYGSISSCGDLVAKGIDYNHISGFMSDNTSNTYKKFIVMDDGTLYNFNGSKNTNMHLAGDVVSIIQDENDFVFDITDAVNKKIDELKDKPFVTADEKQELKDLVNQLPDDKITELQPIIDEIMNKPEKPTDIEAPNATIATDKTTWTNENITLAITATDNVGVKSITLPDGKVVTGSTATWTVSANGKVSFTIEDTAGNKKVAEYTVSNIDNGAPVVTITEKDGKVIVEANDNESSIAKKYFKLDNGEWVETMPELTGLKDGKHTLQAKAADLAGNVSEIASLGFYTSEEANKAGTDALNAVIKAEDSKLQADVDTAKPLITNAKTLAEALDDADPNKATLITNVNNMQNRLDAVQKSIDDANAYAEKLANATAAVVKAENSKLQADVDTARNLVNGLNDTDKSPLNARLDSVQKAIDDAKTYAEKLANATTAVVKAEGSKLQADVDTARSLVNSLNDSDKAPLNARLDIVQKAINDAKAYAEKLANATTAVEKAEDSKLQADVDSARVLVNNLNAGDKATLGARLDAVQKVIDEVKAYAEKLANATTAVVKAEGSKLQADVDTARSLVNNLNDSDKAPLNARLDAVQKAIDDTKTYAEKLANATAAVEKAEGSKLQADVDTARTLVNSLNGTDKTSLNARLDAVQKAIDDTKTYAEKLANATTAVVKAEGSKLQADVDTARSLVNSLNDSDKAPLNARLDAVQNAINVQKILDELAKLADKIKDGTANQSDIDKIKDLVDELPKSGESDDLQKQIDDAQKELDEAKAYAEKLANATAAVVKAEGSKLQTDVDSARVLVNNLNTSDKAALGARLDAVQKAIDDTKAYAEKLANATAAVEKAEGSKLQTDVDTARTLVNTLNASDKATLGARLDAVQKIIDDAKGNDDLKQKALAEATSLVEKAEQSKTRADYDVAAAAVKALPTMPGKVELQRRLDKLNVEMLKEESNARQQEYENMKAAESAVRKASITKKDEDIAKAQELINKLKEGPNKDRLQNWLDSFAPKDDSKLTSGDIYNLQKDAEKALKKAEVYRTQTDIDAAQEAIDKIPDRISTKAIYQARLDKVTVKDGTGSSSNNTYANVLALRNAEKVLKKAELNHSAEDIKVAEELVNALVPSDKKELFVLRVNAEKLMQKAETEPSQENLDAVRESIEELPYGMVKYQLLRRISVVQKSLK